MKVSRVSLGFLMVSIAAMILVTTSVAAQQNPYPTTWRVNCNGYTGILTYTYNPSDRTVSGTLLGTPATGFLVGRHLMLHRSPDGTQLYDGWIVDPKLGAHGQPYYDGTFFIAGTVSELTTQVDGVYPWYGIELAASQPAPAAVQLFSAVAKQPSAAFKSNTYSDVRVATRQFDPVPYHVAPAFRGTVTLQPGKRLVLAGDAAGQAGWSVDNFLLFEITVQGSTTYLACGGVEPLTVRGQSVQRLGRSSLSFRAGEIDLTPHLPVGVPVQLKVSALDYGAVGFISDVFLIQR